MNYQLPINLLIADDHKLITDGVAQLLKEEKTFGEIYIANNGKEAVDKALANNIDCAIMDINMPVLNGLEATKLIKQEKPYVKVLVVSMQCDTSIVSKMLKAGADAFMNKDTGKTELLKAIDKVMHGEKYISPLFILLIEMFILLKLKNSLRQEKSRSSVTLLMVLPTMK